MTPKNVTLPTALNTALNTGPNTGLSTVPTTFPDPAPTSADDSVPPTSDSSGRVRDRAAELHERWTRVPDRAGTDAQRAPVLPAPRLPDDDVPDLPPDVAPDALGAPSAASTRAERRALTAERVEELAHARGRRREHVVEELVLINRPVAWSVAARFSGRGVETEDLRQVAVLGLYKAVIRFDPTLRHDLLSFAVPTITGEVRRWFRDHGWMVRPPRRIQELQQRTGAVVEQLGHELGRTPTPREVARELGVPESEHVEAEAAHGAFRPVSLDLPVGEDGLALGELIVADQDTYAAAQARMLLAPALRTLTPEEAQLLELRFVAQLSQAEIGRRTGISQAQVSRTLATLLHRLRTQIDGDPVTAQAPEPTATPSSSRSWSLSRAPAVS